MKRILFSFLLVSGLFLGISSLHAQIMTFSSGANHPGFSFSGWGSIDGILYPAQPNANGVASIQVNQLCWNLNSFVTRKFGNGGGYTITSNKGHSYTFYPNSQSAQTHTLNWEEIRWVKVVLTDLSTNGVNFSYDFDDVIYTIPVKTAADKPIISASQTEICPGESITLDIAGNLNSATTWKVYSGTCGQNLVASTSESSVNITPSSESTYFIRGEKDECTPIGECSSGTSISFKAESSALTSVVSDMNPICEGEEFNLSASGGTDGEGATIEWYTGPNGSGENLASGLGPHNFTAVITTTYYVRREGLCNISSDRSFTQTVEPCPCKDLGGDADQDGICDGLGIADLNFGVIDEELNGNLSTNDDVGPGINYSGLTSFPGHQNPDAALPSLNSNGTYTFIGTSAGIYKFNIAVCPSGISENCPPSQLRISIIEASDLQSKPIVNTDHGKIKNSSILSLPVLANDSPASPSGILGIPSIITGPQHAESTSVADDGNIIYDPIDTYEGPDTIVYQVCDTGLNPQTCSDGIFIIEVLPANAENSISSSDDFITVLSDIETSNRGSSNGNVLNNDFDPDGDELTTTAQSVNGPGGTFVLDGMGNFTFDASENYIGSENFVYTLNDGMGNTTMATVYVRITTSSGVLPVVYNSFDAKWSEHDVVLNWTTTSEVNNNFFSVERSLNGRVFYSIGRINAKEKDNNGKRKYSFLDRDVSQLTGSNVYYRLRQVDHNGDFEYSSVRGLKIRNSDSVISIYPNPSAGEFSISKLQNVQLISIYNNLGQLVYSKKINEENDLKIQIPSFIPGNYSVIIMDNKKQFQIMRLILQTSN